MLNSGGLGRMWNGIRDIENHRKFEKLHIIFSWAFFVMSLIYYFLVNVPEKYLNTLHVNSLNITFDITFFSVGFVYYSLITILYKRKSNINLIPLPLSGIMAFSYIMVGIYIVNIGLWAILILFLQIVLISLERGTRVGLFYTLTVFITHIFVFLIKELVVPSIDKKILVIDFRAAFFVLPFAYIIICFFTVFCGALFKQNTQRLNQNKQLLKELETKCSELSLAREEIQAQNENLSTSNLKLEESNLKLKHNLAELFTLQQISQAISSIFDLDELLKYVNDVIIGVMGVSTCSIILYNEQTGNLMLHTSNIREQFGIESSDFDCPFLTNVLLTGKYVMDNNVSTKHFPFVGTRQVGSFICTPISTKTKKNVGLIFAEHIYTNAFDDESVKLLNIICQQVGITIENAELYRRMQEMATRDWLTGLHNRVYFQEKLYSMIQDSELNSRPLSLIIFDIDFYKRFNDTYGHLFGDHVLQIIAKSLTGMLETGQVAARFGGEEFIILLPELNLDEAYIVAEEIRKTIEAIVVRDNLIKVSVTASFGVSSYPSNSKSSEQLIKHADDALYLAKASGRNCVKTIADLE